MLSVNRPRTKRHDIFIGCGGKSEQSEEREVEGSARAMTESTMGSWVREEINITMYVLQYVPRSDTCTLFYFIMSVNLCLISLYYGIYVP